MHVQSAAGRRSAPRSSWRRGCGGCTRLPPAAAASRFARGALRPTGRRSACGATTATSSASAGRASCRARRPASSAGIRGDASSAVARHDQPLRWLVGAEKRAEYLACQADSRQRRRCFELDHRRAALLAARQLEQVRRVAIGPRCRLDCACFGNDPGVHTPNVAREARAPRAELPAVPGASRSPSEEGRWFPCSEPRSSRPSASGLRPSARTASHNLAGFWSSSTRSLRKRPLQKWSTVPGGADPPCRRGRNARTEARRAHRSR